MKLSLVGGKFILTISEVHVHHSRKSYKLLMGLIAHAVVTIFLGASTFKIVKKVNFSAL